jgi:acylphosphatase
MEEKMLFKILITGHVQGVGFRWSAANEARNRDIKGFIKNMPDGTVYIEAEGTLIQLNTFIEWCKRGPSFGFVESVKVDTVPPLDYSDFRIMS